MEYTVHKAFLFADAVQHRADGIGDAAEEQQQQAARFHRPYCRVEGEDDAPAHADVADHGKYGIFLQIDRRQRSLK